MMKPVFEESKKRDRLASKPKRKTKNKHLLMIAQLRKREEEWDNRFFLDNIPEYQPEAIKNIIGPKFRIKTASQRNRPQKLQKTNSIIDMVDAYNLEEKIEEIEPKYEENPNDLVTEKTELAASKRGEINVARKKNPHEVKTRMAAVVSKQQMPTQQELLEAERTKFEDLILETWETQNIPHFHREIYSQVLTNGNAEQAIEILKREIDALQANTALIQNAMRSVLARENCLKLLREHVNKMNEAEESFTEERNEHDFRQLKKAKELLNHMRILSLSVVECILKWRDDIKKIYYKLKKVKKSKKKALVIPYLHEGTNYLIKMKTDTNYLLHSSLARYFTFSEKSDPFLIYPSHGDPLTDRQPLPISSNLINRIRASEIIILEESVQEHMVQKKIQENQSNPESLQRSLNEKSISSLQKSSHRLASPPTKENPRRFNKSEPKTNQNKPLSSASARGIGKVDTTANRTANRPATAHKSSAKIQLGLPRRKSSEEKESLALDQFDAHDDTSNRRQSPRPWISKLPDLKIVPIEATEDDFPSILEKYLTRVDANIKNSFANNGSEIISACNSGHDPRWFYMFSQEQGSEPIGLAAINTSNSNVTPNKLQIVYLTTTQSGFYEDCLRGFTKYLWEKDGCENICIEIRHVVDENGYSAVDKAINEILKGCGFRWKRVVNEQSNKTVTEYAIKRPGDGPAQRKSHEQIAVDGAVFLSSGQLASQKESKVLCDNRFMIISSLLNHCDQQLTKFADTDDKKIQGYLKLITQAQEANPDGWFNYGTVDGKTDNYEDLKKQITEKMSVENFLPSAGSDSTNQKFSYSLMSLTYRWISFNKSLLTLGQKNVHYLRMNHKNTEILELKSKNFNSTVYLIPTDDPNVNVFIIDSVDVMKEIESGKSTYENATLSILQSLDKDGGRAIQSDIWIPCFQKAEFNRELPEATVCFKEDHKIASGTTSFSVKVGADPIYEGALKVQPKADSKVFKTDFVFGLMHDKLDIPVFSVYVKESDFIADK